MNPVLDIAILKALREFGIPKKSANIIKEMYNDVECKGLSKGKTSDNF